MLKSKIKLDKLIHFTLVELLIVIAIIAILASLLLPALRKAKQTAQSSICKSNLKQYTIGVLNYAQDFDDMAPPHWDGSKRWSDLLNQTDVLPKKTQEDLDCPTNPYPPYTTIISTHYAYSRSQGLQRISKYKSTESLLLGDAGYRPNEGWNPARCGYYIASYDYDRSVGYDIHPGANLVFVDGHVRTIFNQNEFDPLWTTTSGL